MSALDRALQTVELVDGILQVLPLDSFLQAQSVCRLWRELISTSKRLRQIQLEPYIGVRLRLPSKCSVAQEPPAMIEADLVLYYDQPVTIFMTPARAQFPSNTFIKAEEDEQNLDVDRFRSKLWGNKYLCRPDHFRADTYHNWETLLPGKPYSLTWTYRRDKQNPRTLPLGWEAHPLEIIPTDIYKTFVMMLRPKLYAGHFVGSKVCLMARKERGENLGLCMLRDGLPLVSENQVRYQAVP